MNTADQNLSSKGDRYQVEKGAIESRGCERYPGELMLPLAFSLVCGATT